eukprot:1332888-Rhodomonas_salina.3
MELFPGFEFSVGTLTTPAYSTLLFAENAAGSKPDSVSHWPGRAALPAAPTQALRTATPRTTSLRPGEPETRRLTRAGQYSDWEFLPSPLHGGPAGGGVCDKTPQPEAAASASGELAKYVPLYELKQNFALYSLFRVQVRVPFATPKMGTEFYSRMEWKLPMQDPASQPFVCASLRRPSDAGAEFKTSDTQQLSPRPHEQPSGYRAWKILKLGEEQR